MFKIWFLTGSFEGTDSKGSSYLVHTRSLAYPVLGSSPPLRACVTVCQDLVTDVRGSGASCHGRMPPPPALGTAEKVTKVRGWQEKVTGGGERGREGNLSCLGEGWKWEFAPIVISSQAMWRVLSTWKVLSRGAFGKWEVVLQKPGAVGGGGWGGGHPGLAQGGQQERGGGGPKRRGWGVQPMSGGGKGQQGVGLAGHTHRVPPAGPGETIISTFSQNRNKWQPLTFCVSMVVLVSSPWRRRVTCTSASCSRWWLVSWAAHVSTKVITMAMGW